MCDVKKDYFDGEYIRSDLFSEVAQGVVDCINSFVREDGRDRRGNARKKISSTQIRKFYEEVLNLKEIVENGKDFKEILPYFKMLKAKANVAYQREVINTNFKRFIEENVDYVGDDEKKFKIFCTFFEAVVAYAKGKIKD